jgi:sulfite exporter TauE/SafE
VTDHLATLAALCGPGFSPGGAGLLLGLLLAGAAGSVMHCTAMCGPFVLGQVADRLARIPSARLCEGSRVGSALLLPYHAGRLTTYAALGALAAQVGAVIGGMPGMLAWLPATLLLLGALMFLAHAAGRIAPRLRAKLPLLDRAPPAWVRGVSRLARGIDRTRPGGGYLLGVALGFLPCGFLYAALAASAAAADAAGGALAMLAFGLGTVPALIVVGVAGQQAGRAWNGAIATAAPVVMLVNAVLLGLMAWQRFASIA